MAKLTLLTKAPGKRPMTALGPKINPKNNGLPMTKIPGPIISLKEAEVEILIQAL